MKKKINIIQLPKIYDPRGSLTVAEESIHVPFKMRHIGWLHPVPECNKVVHSDLVFIALKGEIHIDVSEGKEKNYSSILLHTPHQGLILEKGCSYTIRKCSDDALLLEITA